MGLVKFLAVGRLVKNKDGDFEENQHQIIALLAENKDDPTSYKAYRTHVKQIMNKGASKLKPNRRIRSTSDGNDYDLHVMADLLENKDDQVIVFFAVTDVEFGKTHSVAKLLEEFKSEFYKVNDASSVKIAKQNGPVNKSCQTFLAQLIKKYGTNKVADVQQKVEEVKNVMKDNVNRTLENVEKLEDLESKSETIENSAKQFEKGARGINLSMRCRYYKMTAIIALLVIAILLIIFVPIGLKLRG